MPHADFGYDSIQVRLFLGRCRKFRREFLLFGFAGTHRFIRNEIVWNIKKVSICFNRPINSLAEEREREVSINEPASSNDLIVPCPSPARRPACQTGPNRIEMNIAKQLNEIRVVSAGNRAESIPEQVATSLILRIEPV